jgi:hypothetical protein
MRVHYLAVAQEEIREAASYYEAISPGLGSGFKRELRQLCDLLPPCRLRGRPAAQGLAGVCRRAFPIWSFTRLSKTKFWFWQWGISIATPVSGANACPERRSRDRVDGATEEDAGEFGAVSSRAS